MSRKSKTTKAARARQRGRASSRSCCLSGWSGPITSSPGTEAFSVSRCCRVAFRERLATSAPDRGERSLFRVFAGPVMSGFAVAASGSSAWREVNEAAGELVGGDTAAAAHAVVSSSKRPSVGGRHRLHVPSGQSSLPHCQHWRLRSSPSVAGRGFGVSRVSGRSAAGCTAAIWPLHTLSAHVSHQGIQPGHGAPVGRLGTMRRA
jgi:hypothetical protein